MHTCADPSLHACAQFQYSPAMEDSSVLEIECVGKFTNSAGSFEIILAGFRNFHDENVNRPERLPAASGLDQLATHFRRLCNEGLAHVEKVCSGWCEEAILLYENVGTDEEAEFREQAMKGAEEATKSFGALAEEWKKYLSSVTTATTAVIDVYTAEMAKADKDFDEVQEKISQEKQRSQAAKYETQDMQKERSEASSSGLLSGWRWNKRTEHEVSDMFLLLSVLMHSY